MAQSKLNLTRIVQKIKNTYPDDTYAIDIDKIHLLTGSNIDLKFLEYILESMLINNQEYSSTIFSNMEHLNVKSKQGFVHVYNVGNNLDIILKTSRTDDSSILMREYIIGNTATNYLRRMMPTFVYVLGASFSNNKDFVMYEMVQGDSMEKLLLNDRITFEEWLDFFTQILLALEVAQREFEFTHYDLHPANVMCKKSALVKYQTCIDDKSYHVSTNNVAVIIDYGYASISNGVIKIGNKGYEKYGIMNNMIPGYDMYKLLLYSVSRCSNVGVRDKILQVFEFYGDDDPYGMRTDYNQLSKALKEYGKQGAYTNVAKSTPLMLLEWLTKKYTIPSIKINTTTSRPVNGVKVNKHTSDILVSSYCDTLKFDETTGYLYAKNTIKILKTNMYCTIDSITKLEHVIATKKKDMQSIDMVLLQAYTTIPFMTINELDKRTTDMLSINIGDKHVEMDILTRFEPILKYYDLMQGYIKLLYLATDIKLNKDYLKYITEMISSDRFKIYFKCLSKINQSVRWYKTITGNSKMKKHTRHRPLKTTVK